MSQILLNLLLNAGHASRDQPGARVCIHVRAASANARSGDPNGNDPASLRVDLVECEVADQGVGIPEADRDRIFAPFYTTRDPSEGTGLGLSTAARQAQEMGGSLDLDRAAAPMRTAFVLRLPAARSEAERADTARIRGRNRVRSPQETS